MDCHDLLPRVDPIYDPVIANADSVQPISPGKFHSLPREGILAEALRGVQDASNRVLGEPTEVFLNGGLEHDPKGRHAASAAA